MIKAYHWVPNTAFPKILDTGLITPAIERVSPGFFRDKCVDEFENIKSIARASSYDLNPVALRAAERLAEDRIEDLTQWSRGDFSREEFSQFGCIDLMAGDIESVFLQVGDWVHWGGSDRPTGFVFDAEYLIRQGAVLREKDLAPLYWDGLNKFLQEDWGDIDAAEDHLLQAFVDIQRAHESRGKAAIKALKKLGRRVNAELLWNDRLPVALAVESVLEGQPQEA